jgi:RNA polymerase sigma-70 factor (ECF subfamily)
MSDRTAPSSARTAWFYELIWPHAPTLVRVARCLTHQDADADDLVQEAMLKAFNGLERLHDPAGARAWLLTILRRCHLDRSRKRGNNLQSLVMEPAAPEAHDERHGTDVAALMDCFSDKQVIAALRRLPDEMRWTLLLVDVEQLTEAEAAQVICVPVGTVKSRLHRGRRALFESLRPLAVSLRLAAAEA